MKSISKLFLTLILILIFNLGYGQLNFSALKNIIVETYYISDTIDATDTIGGSLEPGSKTYRIYVELSKGSRLKKIYGDSRHALIFKSTKGFFNNTDRGTSFGKDINDKRLSENTLALDSWLTLGLATKNLLGILKSDDTNGSIVGGIHNDGGSDNISDGLLRNSNPAAGIPLTNEDGLISNNNTLSQWLDNGFKNISGIDTTIFGSFNASSQFISNNSFLQQNSGVAGANSNSNKVLIAQLTTKGEISFKLNIEVLDSNGNNIDYVAEGKQAKDTLLSSYLTYPPLCGCQDTKYLEYNSKYACSLNDSCKNLIVYGCMDPMACNYDLKANFNIKDLCCYPGYCNDRNISLVCPSLGKNDLTISMFPNPAKEILNLQLNSDNNQETKIIIYDYIGRLMIEKNISVIDGNITQQLDISKFTNGFYFLRLFRNDGSSSTKIFLKN